jgi:hypothetical protein
MKSEVNVMKTGRNFIFVGFLLCGTLVSTSLRIAASDSFSVAGEVSGPDVSPEASAVRERLAELRKEIGRLEEGPRRGRFQWVRDRLSRLAEKEEKRAEAAKAADDLLAVLREGKDVSEAESWFGKARCEGVQLLDNGRIGLGFTATKQGVSLVSFYDLLAEREFLSGEEMPIWSLTVAADDGKEQRLTSSEGFDEFRAKESPGGEAAERVIEMEWRGETAEGGGKLLVTCSISLAGEKSSWRMKVDNASAAASIRNVGFPRVSLGAIGESAEDDFLVVPHGSGGLRAAPLRTRSGFSGRYPGGWCSMQFFSHYDADGGLYFAIHDPFASTKDLRASVADGRSVEASVEWPAPDSGVPGNDWECPGEAVLQVFHGDWFDAAQIYKRWVADEAKWWPEKGKWGRSDTPAWFQDIAVWALTGGSAEQVVEPVKKFAEYMGVPTAVHWYNWHVIPFDNDYPHYFPYKAGFPEGIKSLQKAGVRVMPYINGRLWDTDLDDFKNNAIRFCTKDEKGEPYIEVYGSGEKLCPMCPTTKLWRETVQDTVRRLVGAAVGVDAVYIDQVAAATPRLCFDRTHGHPLAGGHWWNTEGYWPMLTELQRELSQNLPEKALTTECNAEPHVHVFDGYLTWHFQYQDQIPLFAAVYGGKVQLFSRAYQGDSCKGLAMRMKTGQALVFGEQLGWIDPNVLSDPESAAFLRRMARLRYTLRDYLARGEMARPPLLKGTIPTVTADWRWGGSQRVTTPAIVSGAWRAEDGRLALTFVNVSDQVQRGELDFNGEQYGLEAAPFLAVTPRKESGPGKTVREGTRFRRTVKLKQHDAMALEIEPGR